MKQNHLQLLSAFLLGALLPSIIFRFAQPQNKTPLPDVQEMLTTLQTVPPVAPIQIPVLTEDATVRQMNLEEYVVGVVLAEMYASFEEAALQAQAVAARTYAMKRYAEGTRHAQGAVCTDPACCQAYISKAQYLQERGTHEDVEKIEKCVELTAGYVLFWEGEFAESTYFSCSGGRTEDAQAVWGADIPYLQSVDSPGEENAAAYTASIYFSKEEFSDKLGRTLSGNPTDWIGMATYTQGGGVSTMVVAGRSYTGIALRRALGLSSTAFTMVAEENGITVHTRGKGHRVGMSQYGAHAMAGQGSDWRQILTHYYPGTEIDKLNTVG